MIGLGPNLEEYMGSQRQVSVHTTHTSGSQSRGGSHLSHEENTRAMQLEIDHLKGSCATNSEDKLLLMLTFLLAMRRMVIIDPDQRLPLVSLSHMMSTTTMSAGTGARLPKVWEMM